MFNLDAYNFGKLLILQCFIWSEMLKFKFKNLNLTFQAIFIHAYLPKF